jgi:hypothetical protein
MTITTIFLLLLLFQFKHFIADYPLQGEYMLGKFKDKGWMLPLFAHVGVHGAFTFIISMFIWICLFTSLWIDSKLLRTTLVSLSL